MPSCEHSALLYTPSPHAVVTSFQWPRESRSLACPATTRTSQKTQDENSIDGFQFPAPLILPDDSLALDGEDDEFQSFNEWKNVSRDRNKVADNRNIIYIVPPPLIKLKENFMAESTLPVDGDPSEKKIPKPDIDAIKKYLEAFYCGLRVKVYKPKEFAYISWDDNEDATDGSSDTESSAALRYVGLNVHGSVTRIRARRDPSDTFRCQLSVEDLLDAAIYMLPKNAYAMCMIVSQDLYEAEEDMFICGRAYGGSRVAVVSSARYHPCLDQIQNVEREHAWPACHCRDYVMAQMPKKRGVGKRRTTSSKKRGSQNDGSQGTKNGPDLMSSLPNPLAKAVTAHKQHFAKTEELQGLWLSRLCRTVSHELGHCFGIAHCMSFACVMQASASISEDARQPPYLCPECLAKILDATDSMKERRYRALETYLDTLETENNCAMFRAFREWLRARTTDLT